VGHVARMRIKKCIQNFIEKNLKEEGRPSRRWVYIIRIDFRIYGGKVRSGFIWFSIGSNDGLL